MPHAESVSTIVEKLGLPMMKSRKWHAQATNCLTGQGVYEGFEKLAEMIREYRKRSGR